MEIKKTFRLSDHATSFATRSKGQELFIELEKMLGEETNSIVIDWTGIQAASPSFVDEFVGRCCDTLMSKASANKLMFTVDDSHITDLIDTILKRRSCAVEHQNGSLGVLGATPRGHVALAQ